jgi:hypothetical protein
MLDRRQFLRTLAAAGVVVLSPGVIKAESPAPPKPKNAPLWRLGKWIPRGAEGYCQGQGLWTWTRIEWAEIRPGMCLIKGGLGDVANGKGEYFLATSEPYLTDDGLDCVQMHEARDYEKLKDLADRMANFEYQTCAMANRLKYTKTEEPDQFEDYRGLWRQGSYLPYNRDSWSSRLTIRDVERCPDYHNYYCGNVLDIGPVPFLPSVVQSV